MEYRVLGSLEVLDRSGHRLPPGESRPGGYALVLDGVKLEAQDA